MPRTWAGSTSRAEEYGGKGRVVRLLVTGAGGFLGRYVVAEALRRGHDVQAMIRPAADASRLPWRDHPQVQLVRADLRARQGLVEAVSGADAVIHLAASVGADVYTQLTGTVVTTENLLNAMREAGANRLIAISSFSVYGYLHKASHSLLDETSPLEECLEERDDYCLAKVLQERLVRKYAEREGWALTVVRPGAIYGKDHVWTACLGAEAGERLWIRIGAWAKVPLTYVENCAEAIVLCAENVAATGETFNVVDNDLPSHRRYIQLLQRRLSPRPKVLPISWTAMRALCRMAWVANSLFFKGEGKLPSILVPARVHARCKPLEYTNAHLRKSLGWTPRYGLAEGLDRSFGNDGLDAADLRSPEVSP